jgi:hypothetical protein
MILQQFSHQWVVIGGSILWKQIVYVTTFIALACLKGQITLRQLPSKLVSDFTE